MATALLLAGLLLTALLLLTGLLARLRIRLVRVVHSVLLEGSKAATPHPQSRQCAASRRVARNFQINSALALMHSTRIECEFSEIPRIASHALIGAIVIDQCWSLGTEP